MQRTSSQQQLQELFASNNESPASLSPSRVNDFAWEQTDISAPLPTPVTTDTDLRSYSRGFLGSFWNNLKPRSRYYVPILGWLPKYHMPNLQGDVIAGISVACLLIPQSLSYADSLARVPPIHGLYAAFAATLVYVAMGTSRQLSVGPEALISMLVGHAIVSTQFGSNELGDNDLDKLTAPSPVAVATLLCFLVGFFNFIFGLLRLGFFDSLLSRPLLRGFITAVAVVIISGQSIAMFGLSALANQELEESASAVEKFGFILRNWGNIHWPTAKVAFSSAAFLLGAGIFKRKMSSQYKWRWLVYVPEILVCVIITTLLSYLFNWSDNYNIVVMGKIDGGGQLPSFSIPSASGFTRRQLHDIIVTAALISVLGFVESVIVAKDYATRYGYTCSPNRELVALGSVNLLVSCVGGFPAFGSIARSRVNDRAGAKSPLSGLITSVVVLMTILWLLPLFEYLPKATLAALIFVAALGLLEETPEDLAFLLKVRSWGDICLLMLTFVITSAASVEMGTIISVGMSVLLVVRHTTIPRISIIAKEKETGRFMPLQDLGSDKATVLDEGLLIIRIEQALYFANTGQLRDRLRRLEYFADLHAHPSNTVPLLPPVWDVALEVENMPSIDASAAQILFETIEEYHRRGIRVHIVRLRRGQPTKMFQTSGLADLIGDSQFYEHVSEVAFWVRQQRANNANIRRLSVDQ